MNQEMIGNPILTIHLFAGIGALILGFYQIFIMPRGTKEHKKLGWFWAFFMSILAITSLWDLIGNGWLSVPAHIFTLATFIFLPLSIWAARNKKIKLHKFCMILLLLVLVAATIALMLVPGRLLNIWLFGA